MRKGAGPLAAVFAMALAWVAVAGAQPAASAARPHNAVRMVASAAFQGEVLREIDDPATGDQWLLVRDPARPAAPGRLVRVRHGTGPAAMKPGERGVPVSPAPILSQPIVRAGDSILVEEHTPVVDARLEAVALEPAAQGAVFRARLTVGGATVRVVADAPGRATLGPAGEVKP